MRRLLLVALSASTLLAGCGGGGGGAPVVGGGGVVVAGPLRVEGQLNSPQSTVVSGLTVYSLTGNITAATLTDASPTVDEAEIIYATSGSNGNEIAAVNADGSGSARTIVANMTGSAERLTVDPSGKYVYYIRNTNLQRTDIRDGTSNTILGSVASFAFNQSGSKICYKKRGSDEIWSANANGSGQTLVANYSDSVAVVGCQSDTIIALNDGLKFQTINITNGNLGRTTTFPNFTFFSIAFSAEERALYIYCRSENTYYVYRQEVPPLDQAWSSQAIFASAQQLLTFDLAAGPQHSFVGFNVITLCMNRVDLSFQPILSFPPDGLITGMAWTLSRTSLPLAGVGTAYPNGMGALICTELGMRTPTLVTADAVTRSSLIVTSLNETQNGSPLFRIDCDNLKSLAYASGNAYLWKSVVSDASGLKGAIVSFDSATGLVANVVTFTKRPTVTRGTQGWIVEGDLDEVISPTEGLRRPAGASVVLR